MNKIFGFILSLVLFFAVTASANAAGYGNPTCETFYGSGVVCPQSSSFSVNKLIQLPTKGGNFVDNLTISDPLFSIGKEVMFQIKVKNTGTSTIDKITVVDTLPAELTYVAGPGSYNSANNTLTIVVDNLGAGKEATYFITTKVVNFTEVKCPVNTVVATSSNGASSMDTASFCAEKTGKPVAPKPVMKKQPETGAETNILFGLLGSGSLGYFLRKRIK